MGRATRLHARLHSKPKRKCYGKQALAAAITCLRAEPLRPLYSIAKQHSIP